MWTTLLPSNHTLESSVAGPTDCRRLFNAFSEMPCSVAATLGYKPAQSNAYIRIFWIKRSDNKDKREL